MSISKVGQRRQVVIPKEVCAALKLEEGDFVEVTHHQGAVIIKPKKLVDSEDWLTPEEERIALKGFKQFQRGESVPWPQVKNDLGL